MHKALVAPSAAAAAATLTLAAALLAQGRAVRYEADSNWPKPLPDQWVLGGLGGVCVDAQDHVFILNRQDVADGDLNAGRMAPQIIEFDSAGSVVNSWADPAKQFLPKAWETLEPAALVTAVHDYTRDTIAAFREAGVLPDMVQIGNEVTPGMLWPHGKLPENWDTFAALLKAGIAGVEAGRGDGPRPRIMLHIEKSGDRERTRWFFDNLAQRGVEFDVIGQSYYPWWHGSLLDLRDTLAFMAETYRKDIYLVEVAYNWRPAEYLDEPAPFPETPEGQRDFLDEVHRVVLATPHGLGKGVFWWEPAVPLQTRIASRGMFDADGNALPVITVFDRWTRGKTVRANESP